MDTSELSVSLGAPAKELMGKKHAVLTTGRSLVSARLGARPAEKLCSSAAGQEWVRCTELNTNYKAAQTAKQGGRIETVLH
jgi:hypothetical protein